MNGAGYPFGTDESIVFGAVAYTSQVRHNNAAVQTVERVSELLGFDIIAAFVVSPFPQDMMVNRRQFRRQTEQLCIGKTATTNGDGYLPTLFGVFFFFLSNEIHLTCRTHREDRKRWTETRCRHR